MVGGEVGKVIQMLVMWVCFFCCFLLSVRWTCVVMAYVVIVVLVWVVACGSIGDIVDEELLWLWVELSRSDCCTC